jgi:hypothetical protein
MKGTFTRLVGMKVPFMPYRLELGRPSCHVIQGEGLCRLDASTSCGHTAPGEVGLDATLFPGEVVWAPGRSGVSRLDVTELPGEMA